MDLERFTAAQADIYDTALAELRAGRKRSHWIWFVFPQLRGLGHSPTAQFYGIEGLAEARAYLAHPVLGPRLTECAEALLAQPDDDPARVMGQVDALKLRSSATLFEAAGGGGVFGRLLERFFGGDRCARTLEMIGDDSAPG